jgi:hypothetical protein
VASLLAQVGGAELKDRDDSAAVMFDVVWCWWFKNSVETSPVRNTGTISSGVALALANRIVLVARTETTSLIPQGDWLSVPLGHQCRYHLFLPVFIQYRGITVPKRFSIPFACIVAETNEDFRPPWQAATKTLVILPV